MVRVNIDVGQKFEQHPLGRLHHPVGHAGRDAHGPGGAAYPLDLALVRQLERLQLPLDGTAEEDLAAAQGRRAAFADFDLQALVICGC